MRHVTAHFVAAYTEACGIGAIGPSGDEVLITMPGSPDASMRGTNACTPWATPNTLTLNVHFQSFGVESHTNPPGGPTPALLHSTCTAP